MLSKEQMENMNEASLRVDIILPLLVAMGYHDVTETHRAGELGKDIVFWDTDKLGQRVNYAVVVKATDITGSAEMISASAGNVQTQIRQCFNAPYRDPRSGEERRVHQCWVMTSKRIGPNAVEAITAALEGNQTRDVRFIDGTRLWRLVEEYLPVQAVWQKAREVFETLDSLDSHYRVVVRPADAGPGLDAYIEEKYPGAATDKPFSVGTTLTFPSTTEGQEAKEAFERHLTTGSAVELPGEFVALTEVPELLRHLAGGEFKVTRLSLQPAPATQPIPMRIVVENEANEHFAIDYAEFQVTQAGTDEITLKGEAKALPFRATIIMRPGERRASINLTFLPEARKNPREYLALLEFERCISRPGQVRFIDLRTNILLLEMPLAVSGDIRPAPDLMRVVEDLAIIQQQSMRPIAIPDRELTEDELETVRRLSQIRRTGVITGIWEDIRFAMPLASTRNVLDNFSDGASHTIGFEGEEAVEELFGARIPLGPTRIILNEARLANEETVREQVARASGGDVSIELPFNSGDDKACMQRFLAWIPPVDTPLPNKR